MKLVYALGLGVGMALDSVRKRRLTTSGAVAAMIIGIGTAFNPSNMFTALLFGFFLSSSQLTKWSAKRKARVEEHDIKEAKQGRNYIQVICNSLTGTALAIFYAYQHWHEWDKAPTFGYHSIDTKIILGFIGFYACCCGDTWASELGVLSESDPLLITTLKPVPTGTNGGVSLMGLIASFSAGKLMALLAGVSLYLEGCTTIPWMRLVFFGGMAGLGGSLIDSLLGATPQPSYRTSRNGVSEHAEPGSKHISGLALLTNNEVNFISSLLTTAITFSFGHLIFT
ncbi:integral membrane protein DUF92-domain-containing protein [Syncephalis fuscata]|nr:integral membrane protein DUF92-domain-containing protein [Syncephalis fuscata]